MTSIYRQERFWAEQPLKDYNGLFYPVIKELEFDSEHVINLPHDFSVPYHPIYQKYWTLYKQLYKNNLFSNYTSQTKMPKLLHIYWDTGKLYTLYEYQLKRCMELNPGWELYFWTEKNLT